jgi:glycosyltransferase involved in cell wall biosynthesis
MRLELGLKNEVLLVHSSNLRPLKRVDLLLEAAALIKPKDSFKLLILAGGNFAPYAETVRRLGLEGRVIVREEINEVEDYLQAADLGLISSDSESFCLSILEAMFFAVPSVATRVGGVPEVVENGVTGLLVPPGNAKALAAAAEALIQDPARRRVLGEAAAKRAREFFSAEIIVPRYEALYRRICGF